jgi:hypothetical protein
MVWRIPAGQRSQYCVFVFSQGGANESGWRGTGQTKAVLFWLKLTADDIAHRVGVGKGFEYELRGAALVHCEGMWCDFGVLGGVVRRVRKGFGRRLRGSAIEGQLNRAK